MRYIQILLVQVPETKEIWSTERGPVKNKVPLNELFADIFFGGCQTIIESVQTFKGTCCLGSDELVYKKRL